MALFYGEHDQIMDLIHTDNDARDGKQGMDHLKMRIFYCQCQWCFMHSRFLKRSIGQVWYQ